MKQKEVSSQFFSEEKCIEVITFKSFYERNTISDGSANKVVKMDAYDTLDLLID